MRLYLDTETRSTLDLRRVGAAAYARHPDTEVLCVGWAIDHGPVRVWTPDDPPGKNDGWRTVLDSATPGLVLVAHNVGFDREILSHVLGYGTPLEWWDDTACRAAALSLPRRLDDVAMALGLKLRKDKAGGATMLKLARPRRPSLENKDPFWTPKTKPDEFAALYDYCARDVEVLRALDERLPPLSPFEREVWYVTEKMNGRGVKVDVPTARLASTLVEAERERLEAEYVGITGVRALNPVESAEWLGLPDVRRATIRGALKVTPADAPTRTALLLRERLSRVTSLAKLAAIADQVCDDQRMRGMLLYAGAERTGRWSGRLFQPQNLPRGDGTDPEVVFRDLRAGILDLTVRDPLAALSGALRGLFVGPFAVSDYRQIEARVLAWLAGEKELLQAFRDGRDIYKEMAASIYGYGQDTKLVTKDQRFLGKTVILGAGYGLGWQKFQSTLEENNDVVLSNDMAQRTITAYREKFPGIPALWRRLENGVKHVLQTRKSIQLTPHLGAGLGDAAGLPALWIELPSGRRVYYVDACLRGGKLRYRGREAGAWGWVDSWGGKLTENVVQAISRDIMADAMVRVDKLGHKLILSVHDEIVCESSDEKPLHEAMLEIPDWAGGLPIDVESFTAERYRK
jgi:DNA polymerase